MTTTPEAERLEPCPFCGSSNLSLVDIRDFIACRDCGTEGPMKMGQGSEDCIAAWNRRAALSQPDEARDAARWRFVTSHAAEEQNEVAICGMGTFVGGGPQNGLRVWGASFGVDAEALVDAAMSKEQP